MALIKHKVLESDCKDGEVDIPEKATPIGITYGPAGGPSIAFIMKHSDWAEEFPDDAKKEEESKKGAADGK